MVLGTGPGAEDPQLSYPNGRLVVVSVSRRGLLGAATSSKAHGMTNVVMEASRMY
jgi:hypothetical protein